MGVKCGAESRVSEGSGREKKLLGFFWPRCDVSHDIVCARDMDCSESAGVPHMKHDG